MKLEPSVLRAYDVGCTGMDGFVLQLALDLKLPLMTFDGAMKGQAFELGIPVILP